jgi:hypothetical protein
MRQYCVIFIQAGLEEAQGKQIAAVDKEWRKRA